MKKRLLAIFLAVVLCLNLLPAMAFAAAPDTNDTAADTGISAVAETGTTSGDWTYTLQGDNAVITAYAGSDTVVTIPDTIDGHTVDSISALVAVNAGATFTSVTIPASVTKFETTAFKGMPNLQTVIFAEGSQLKAFPFAAFEGCTALTGITIPDGMTELNNNSFMNCTSLESITIPAAVTELGDQSFIGCGKLADVCFAENSRLTNIKWAAFKQCTSLKSITLPGSVTSIGTQAFEQCTTLEEVHLPANLKSLGSQVFLNCRSLRSIELPEGLTTISYQALSSCYSLSSVNFPSTLETIGQYAFLETALTEVHIPESVQRIDQSAFNNISTLTDVYLPNSADTPKMGLATDAYTFYNNANPALLTIHVYEGSFGETWAKTQQKQLGFNIAYRQPPQAETVTVAVVDENNAAVSSGYTVNWLVDGKQVSETSPSYAVPAGTETCSFQVMLGDGLLKTHYLPKEQSVTLTGENRTVTVKLEKIPDLTVTGIVQDQNGKPISDAAVTFDQGTQERVSATTLADGSFSAVFPNVSTTYTVSADGYLSLSGTAILNVHSGNALDLGSLTLRPLPQCRVEIVLEQATAAVPGGTPAVTALSDLTGHTFTVQNNTSGQAVDCNVQGSCLFFPAGVSARETLTVTLDGGIDTKTVTLNNNGLGKATLRYRENGSIQVEALNGDGPFTALLYGGTGKLLQNTTVGGSYQSPALPDGGYTLLLLEKNDLICSAASPDAMGALGLTEGTDYLRLTPSVARGVVTYIASASVPAFNESKFSFVDAAATQVSVDSTVGAVGKLVLFRAAYALREGVTGAQSMSVTIPDGLTLQGSPTVDGVVPAGFTNSGNTVTIPVTAPKGVIRFYVMASAAGSYGITPVLHLQTGSQPLGTAAFTATAAAISVPGETSNKSVSITGTALPNSAVVVYDNGKQAVTATANSAGTWHAVIQLQTPADYEFHEVYASVTRGNVTYETEHATFLYTKAAVDVAKVSMYNTVSGVERCTVFDYENPTAGSAYYILEDREFTFKIEFAKNEAVDRLENVRLNVFTRGGGMYSYEATKIKPGVYAAAASNIVPVNVGVSYTCSPPAKEDDLNYNGLTEKEYRSQAAEELRELKLGDTVDMLEVKNVQYLGDGMDTFRLTFGAIDSQSDDGSWLDMDFAVLPYEETEKTLKTRNFQELKSGKEYQLGVLSEEELEYIYVNTETETAISITLPWELTGEAAESQMFSARAGGRRGMGLKIFYELTEKSGVPFLSEYVAYQDLSDLHFLLTKQHYQAFDEIGGLLDLLGQLKNAKCEDGSYRLSSADYTDLSNKIFKLYNKEEEIKNRMQAALDRYQQRILNSLLFSLGTMGIGSLAKLGISKMSCFYKSGIIVGGEVTWNEVRSAQKLADASQTALETAFLGVDTALDHASDEMTGYELPDVSQKDSFMDSMDIYSTPYYNAIIREYESLEYTGIDEIRNEIYRRLRRCQDEPDPGESPKSPCPDKDPAEDPSGQVYEAVPTNLLSGVTATVRKKDGNGNMVTWDAGAYDQINPQVTGEDGFFYWNVPEGEYDVEFTKTGYVTAYSGTMTVPPPRTGLLIPMVSTQPPAVAQVKVYTDRSEVTFSQYMDIASVQAAMTLLQDGTAIEAAVEALDTAVAANGTTQYATRFALVPKSSRITSPVIVHIGSSAKNYNSTSMSNDYTSDALAPEVRPTALVAPSSLTVGLNGTAELAVILRSGPGRKLTVETGGSSLFSISQTTATTDGSGAASFMLTGLLPGTTRLRVTDPESGLEQTVQVVVGATVVEPVTAALTDGTILGTGSVIPSGSRVALSAGAGAEIRYTLDDTCPKTNGVLYIGPITLTGNTVLRAVAVKDGTYSNTIRLELTVKGGTATSDPAGPTPVEPSGPSEPDHTQPDPALVLPFTDINVGDWYYDAVAWAVDQGITVGTSTTTFSPDVSCTRAQIVTFLWRTDGSPKVTGENPFTDVKAGDYYYDAVLWAVSRGITTGTSATTFSPDTVCTRAQAVTFLHRAAGTPAAAGSSPFTDVVSGSYYTDAVQWAACKGVVNGTTPTTFSPDQTCTRAQIVTLLYRDRVGKT